MSDSKSRSNERAFTPNQ